jgi:hypothetical protein
LFLSKDDNDVQAVIDSKASAAARIYEPLTEFDPKDTHETKKAPNILNVKCL